VADGQGLCWDDFVDDKMSKDFPMPAHAVVLVLLEDKVTEPSAANGPGDTLLLHLSSVNLLSFALALHASDERVGWTRFGEEDLEAGRVLLDKTVRHFVEALAARQRAVSSMLPVEGGTAAADQLGGPQRCPSPDAAVAASSQHTLDAEELGKVRQELEEVRAELGRVRAQSESSMSEVTNLRAQIDKVNEAAKNERLGVDIQIRIAGAGPSPLSVSALPDPC